MKNIYTTPIYAVAVWVGFSARQIRSDWYSVGQWVMSSIFSVRKYLKKKGRTLIIGHTVNWMMEDGFDYLLYPFIIGYFGLVVGTPIAWIASFLICYWTIGFYDRSKTDWLGIEDAKDLKNPEMFESPIGKMFARLLKKGDVVVMIVLSIWKDPFITVAYMRKGAHQYNGMSRRDWAIFMTSWLISNVYWTFVVYKIVIPVYELDNAVIAGVVIFFLSLYAGRILLLSNKKARRYFRRIDFRRGAIVR